MRYIVWEGDRLDTGRHEVSTSSTEKKSHGEQIQSSAGGQEGQGVMAGRGPSSLGRLVSRFAGVLSSSRTAAPALQVSYNSICRCCAYGKQSKVRCQACKFWVSGSLVLPAFMTSKFLRLSSMNGWICLFF